ncbi:MAG: hypothetical protein ACXVB0_07835 [Mucilaginibacter sp.]
MKISAIVAKAVSRLFLLLVFLAAITLYQGDNTKLQHIYFAGHNRWGLVFPGLLLAGFIVLLIYCTRKKFSMPDINWLLVVNTVVLMAYCATLYIRVHDLIK